MKPLPEREDLFSAARFLKHDAPEVAGFLEDIANGVWTLRRHIKHRDVHEDDPFGCICDDCTALGNARAHSEVKRLRLGIQALNDVLKQLGIPGDRA